MLKFQFFFSFCKNFSYFIRHMKIWLIIPSRSQFGRLDFLLTERGSMRSGSTFFGGCSFSDNGFCNNQTGLVRYRQGFFKTICNFIVIVSITMLNMPPISLKSFTNILAHRQTCISCDGDIVTVVKGNQIPQSQMPCPGSRFGSNPLLHISITAKDKNPGID